MTKDKKISAALIITDGEKVLVELATGRKRSMAHNLDLPKGEVDDNEDPLDTAIRETKEETGLDISSFKDEIKEIGLLPYRKTKDIYLCYLKLDELPDLNTLHCDSYFKTAYGELPEIKDYYYINKDELVDCLYNDYQNTLTPSILEQVFNE